MANAKQNKAISGLARRYRNQQKIKMRMERSDLLKKDEMIKVKQNALMWDCIRAFSTMNPIAIREGYAVIDFPDDLIDCIWNEKGEIVFSPSFAEIVEACRPTPGRLLTAAQKKSASILAFLVTGLEGRKGISKLLQP